MPLGIHVAADPGRDCPRRWPWGNVARHHAARSHHRLAADLHAGQDRRVGADRGAVGDGRPQDCSWMLLAAGKLVVGEGGVGADEDVVAHAKSVPKLHAALDGHAVAQNHVVLDEDVVADVAVAADPAPGRTWANAQIRVPSPTRASRKAPRDERNGSWTAALPDAEGNRDGHLAGRWFPGILRSGKRLARHRNETRPALGVLVDPPNVGADHAHPEQLAGGREEDRQDDRRVAGHREWPRGPN